MKKRTGTAISFTATFGETYLVTITGDKLNGHQAVLGDSD